MLPELPLPRKPPALNKGGRFSRMGSVFDEEAPGEAAQPQQVTRVIVEKILGASAVGLIFFLRWRGLEQQSERIMQMQERL